MINYLTPENAFIFRVTHVQNVAWVLQNGLHCRNGQADPNFVEIGNPDLIGKRAPREVPVEPGGTLSDYIPFYFTPSSPMLYNIKTGWNGITQRAMCDIAILATSLRKLEERGIPFVFTDRHAYLRTAIYSRDLRDLVALDWRRLQAQDFKRSAEEPDKVERYQAEALVYQTLPVDALMGIACCNVERQAELGQLASRYGANCPILHKPEWYF